MGGSGVGPSNKGVLGGAGNSGKGTLGGVTGGDGGAICFGGVVCFGGAITGLAFGAEGGVGSSTFCFCNNPMPPAVPAVPNKACDAVRPRFSVNDALGSTCFWAMFCAS